MCFPDADHGLDEGTFTLDDFKETYTYWQFTSDINSGKIEPLKSTTYTIDDYNADIDRHYVHYYPEEELTYEEFMEAANVGEYIGDDGFHMPVRIQYDYIAGTKVDDTDIRDEKIYFYLNHMVFRLESFINDIEYLYTLGDASTPLQELLIKFIKFFKSYTVELISFELIVIVDIKPDNTIRLFDVPHYIQKLIWTRDNIHLAYSDVVRCIISIYLEDKFKLRDRYVHYAEMMLKEYINISDLDTLYHMVKELLVKDKSMLFDVAHGYESEFTLEDRSPNEHFMRDSVVITYE